MIDAITKLLDRQDTPEVVELSNILALIEDGLRTTFDPISQQEYVELMADVERLKKIIELKGNLELNQMIHDAVIGIIELAKMVKL